MSICEKEQSVPPSHRRDSLVAEGLHVIFGLLMEIDVAAGGVLG